MKLHELKIKDQYAYDIVRGAKTFELRKNDRDYQEGYLISFEVVDSCNNSILPQAYVIEGRVYKITYVLKDVPEYGLDKDYCILGIERSCYDPRRIRKGLQNN